MDNRYTLTKDDQGATIWLRGTDNNRRRSGPTPLERAEVVKVNPKTAVIRMTRGGFEKKITHTGGDASGCHFNYVVFPSREAAVKARQAEAAVPLIQERLKGYGGNRASDDLILQVAELLGVELVAEPDESE